LVKGSEERGEKTWTGGPKGQGTTLVIGGEKEKDFLNPIREKKGKELTPTNPVKGGTKNLLLCARWKKEKTRGDSTTGGESPGE